jgi:Collagen triple helix repeat (20 copies)
MLERLRNQIGTAGLIVAIVALVAALGGGAYAATSNSGKATASAKGKPGPRGKTGKTGPAGPAGPAGPVGPAGPQGPTGPAGAKGDKGDVGATGANGTPGSTGPQGPKGDPWTAGGILPEGETETGTWGTGPLTPAGKKYFPISFTLPLALEPEPILVEATEESKPGCPGRGGGSFLGAGDKPTTPEADPGKLCVYVMPTEGATFLGFLKYEYEAAFNEWASVPGASRTGTLLSVNCLSVCLMAGTWAVTGPEE